MPQVLNWYKIGKLIPEGAVDIRRPSIYGNPFPIDKEHSRETQVDVYENWVYTQPWLLKAIKENLRGKDVVCTCAPLRCHGDIIVKIANS